MKTYIEKNEGTFNEFIHDAKFREKIFDYILQGDALTEVAKKAGGLEKTARSERKGFFRKAIDVFKEEKGEEHYKGVKDLQRLISSDPNYSAALGKEITEAVSVATRAHYIKNAIEVASANELIGNKLYRELKEKTNGILSRTEGAIQEGFKGLEKYLTPEESKSKLFPYYARQTTVLILGAVLVFIFNPTNLNGAVIGLENFSEKSGFFFVGIGLIILSLLSFIFKEKNNDKEKKRKKKIQSR